jgi:hypothetical protein
MDVRCVLFLAFVRKLMQRPAFDPKPFITSFEAAVDKLISIRKDVQAKTEQMEKSVRVSEREYSKKMVELTKGFEVWFDQLSSYPRLQSCCRLSETLLLGWKVA